jgi:hypothetical protein
MADKRIKTGGRTAGTPNKLTFHTRQLLLNAVSDELEELPELLARLAPAQRVDCLIKLCKYALPPMANMPATFAENHSLDSADNVMEAVELENATAKSQRDMTRAFL